MIYFVIIALLLSTLSGLLVGNIVNKKWLSLLNFFSFFAFIQVNTYALTQTHIISYKAYTGFTWSLMFIFFILSFGFQIWLTIKNKQYFTKAAINNILISKLPFIISVVFACTLLLFVKTSYSDTTAYISISCNFRDNLYCFNKGAEVLNGSYSVSQQFFFYATLGNVNVCYYYFNPLIAILAALLIMEYFFEGKESKWYLLIKSFLNIAIVLSYSFWTYLISSGNLDIQSIILCLLFVLLFKDQVKLIPIVAVYLSFFSATGSIIGTITLFGLLVYSFIFRDKKDVFMFLFAFLISIPLNVGLIIPNLITTSDAKKIIYICLVYLYTYGLIIGFIFVHIHYKKNIENNKLIFDSKVNVIAILRTVIIVASVITSLALVIMSYTNWIKTQHFFIVLTIVSLIFAIGINVYYFLSKKFDYSWNDCFTMTSLFSALIPLIFVVINLTSLKSNASVWRIIYLMPMMGEVTDIVLFSFIVLFTIFWNFDFTLDFKNKKNKVFSSLAIGLTATSSVVIPITTFTTIPKITNEISNVSFSSNVKLNYNKFSNKDIDYLNNLNSKINDQTKLFGSVPYYTVMDKGLNYSYKLIEQVYNDPYETRPWAINAYGIIGGLSDYAKYSFNEQIDNAFNSLDNAKLTNYLVQMDLDWYIFNKHEFVNLFGTTNLNKANYNGDEIVVFGKA